MSHEPDDLLDALAFADGVHAVRASDGLVFLDIDRDAYFCLYARAGADDADNATAEAIRAQLTAHGLVAERPTRNAAARPVTRLWREDCARNVRPMALRDLAYFLRALVAAAWRFRRSSLAQMIAHVRAGDIPVPRASHADVAARFERLCLWLPFRVDCLFRAFLLLHLLRYHGLSADWIFGVSLFPFHAHCWLANGDLLLAERVAKVEGFETIFQIERASA
ncbi:lasso peptide biosynthesis B2 protein [Sphingomonas sp. NFR15]|uniref:lasso peptide biosynthesis B2 protein n=1 Tax=Sphingomonas sp. NFR15 TaxID=1566282 RepID=UPI00088DFA27|nr:lasso peptide biosynthesis B2 protein [Sphingomonas sp. NFR15]SDA36910.1 Transglutaminase-like superfamily protein [Sphingomonas sp. NFR15]